MPRGLSLYDVRSCRAQTRAMAIPKEISIGIG